MKPKVLITALLIGLFSSLSKSATAQVPTVPVALRTLDGHTEVEVTAEDIAHPIAILTRRYLTGDWVGLQQEAKRFLNVAACQSRFFPITAGRPCDGTIERSQFDFKRDMIFLIWAASDFKGKRSVYRVLLTDPSPHPYDTVLPGVATPSRSRVYEVLISDIQHTTLTSYYTSVRNDNPLAAQLPLFASQIVVPLFATTFAGQGGVPSSFGPLDSQPERSDVTRRFSTYISASEVHLPLRRATVRATHVLTLPLHNAALTPLVSRVAARLEFVEARYSACSRSFVAEIKRHISEVASTCNKGADCRADLDQRFAVAYEQALTKCSAHSTLQDIDKAFREFIVGLAPEQLSAEFTLQNSPRRHVGLGALTSYAFSGQLNGNRVKLNAQGIYELDPLRRHLSLLVLNYSPAGFQERPGVISWSERLRPFVGAVVAPEFGVGAGLSFLVWSGLGINVGVAHMWIPLIADDKELGQKPTDRNDPFRLGTARTAFIGVSFNFR
jgi:hypothetical protein